ncbi:MAG: VOC family protein [Candidatus Micrarchaeota archaeon]|nr:VOC family protein [Candidatus Micrarchaeota archaeon]
MGLVSVGIRVRNVKKSVRFYTRSLGMRVISRKSFMPGETVIGLRSPDTGAQLRLMHYEKNCRLYKPYEKGDEMDHLSFEVKDAARTFLRLVKNGAPVAMPLRVLPARTMGYVKDPDGIWVGLASANRPAQGRKIK